MNLIQCLSHKNLQWKPEFPSIFKGYRIPGSEAFTTAGEYGCVSVQQYQGDQFRIRLYSLQLSQTFIFKSLMPCTEMQSLISLGGKWKLQPSPNVATSFLEKHHLVLPGRVPELLTISAYYTKGILFELCFSSHLLAEMNNSFPAAMQRLQQPEVSSLVTATINTEMISLIGSITHCTYSPSIRSAYFNSKVRDILFQFLLTMESQEYTLAADTIASDKELVADIEQIIIADLSHQFSLEELAARVSSTKARVRRAFKIIKGMPPFEYLAMQRMQRALAMLEQGLMPKQVARATGYQPSAFTKAFYKFYGKLPREV